MTNLVSKSIDLIMNNTSKLIEILKRSPKAKGITTLIKLAESESNLDITKQLKMLTGVWELRWSSSKSPLLN